MKELLMESASGESVRDEVLAQFLAKDHRTAEPDVRRLPFRHDSANVLSGHSPILGGDPDAQKHVRGFRELAQLLDRRDVTRARRVKQIDCLSVGVRCEFLHPRDERRDADSCTHPDLAFAMTLEGETPVRAFDRDKRAWLKCGRKRPCVISQSLDEEKQVAVALPGRRDGERMRTFAILEVHECELPRIVTAPTVLETNTDLQNTHVRARRDFIDLTNGTVRVSNSAKQHQDR